MQDDIIATMQRKDSADSASFLCKVAYPIILKAKLLRHATESSIPTYNQIFASLHVGEILAQAVDRYADLRK